MTEDLVKRLRKNVMCGDAVIEEAADRIEKDAQHIDEMYGLVAAMNAEHTTSKTRIEQLEAANLKAALIKVDDMARIEQLEAALRDCVNVLACFERPDFYQLERTSPIKPYALGALDVARKSLEGKDD